MPGSKRTLVFDIETIGEDFNSMDSFTQEYATKSIRQNSQSDEDFQRGVTQLKDRFALSPYYGQVVAIGTLDVDTQQGGVYYQTNGQAAEVITEDGIKLEAMSEADMLQKFWSIAERYQCLVGFNSRCFDAPFLNIRSAIHKIRPTVDLMENRYTNSQRKTKHIDLQDQLCYYGAMSPRGSLHAWTRAFGIESPKDGELSGDQVGEYYRAGRYLEIAKYNLLDLVATRQLYLYWRDFLDFSNINY